MVQREGMLKFFSNMKSVDEQNVCLQKCCKINTPLRNLDAQSKNRPKLFSVKYYLSYGMKREIVIKKSFFAFYGIKKKK